MNTFPLIRAKWSNEHIMAALFLVLLLYHLPQWREDPAKIINFLLITFVGLFIDAIANFLRYKRLWCSVSAAITVAVISLLASGVPLWGQLLGVAAALIIGKHIFGGTGKNLLNPAMVGLLVVLILWKIPYPFFADSYLLIPAILLSLLFLMVRPYAGIGFLIGMTVSLIFHKELTLSNVLQSGIFFWSCIVITDPVTVTGHPLTGSIGGLLAGFAAMYLQSDLLVFVIVVLVVNLYSYVIESLPDQKMNKLKPQFHIPKAVTYNKESFLDLSEEKSLMEEAELGVSEMSAEEVITSIKYNEIFGMGGAAFPTHQKINSIRFSKKSKKYLIINGVECDPGLIHDHYILLHYPEEIKKGIEILERCAEFTSVHLAVKNDEGLDFSESIKLHKLPDCYPVGAEKILIKEVLNLILDKDQIPAVNGILVLNVQTVYAIYQAIYLNKPADTRFLTVANLKENTAQVVKVRLGMKIKEVLDKVYPGSVRYFAGGGIMQAYSADEDMVIDKSVNFIATGPFPKFKESPQCSQCKGCSRNCPAGLQVSKISDLVDRGKVKDALKYHPEECIECGSCSYSCLAGRNLANRVKAAKEASKVI